MTYEPAEDGYIQVGVTAMRNPISGEPLPSVPLYIRAADRERVEAPVIDEAFFDQMIKKFGSAVLGRGRKK